mgnify:CR=1 FL=1
MPTVAFVGSDNALRSMLRDISACQATAFLQARGGPRMSAAPALSLRPPHPFPLCASPAAPRTALGDELRAIMPSPDRCRSVPAGLQLGDRASPRGTVGRANGSVAPFEPRVLSYVSRPQ